MIGKEVAHSSPIPLSELRMMKALLSTSRPPAGERTTHETTTTGARARDSTTLRPPIIDKLQVLALRRPPALIILAEVLDELLGQQLGLLDPRPDRLGADKSRTRDEG